MYARVRVCVWVPAVGGCSREYRNLILILILIIAIGKKTRMPCGLRHVLSFVEISARVMTALQRRGKNGWNSEALAS